MRGFWNYWKGVVELEFWKVTQPKTKTSRFINTLVSSFAYCETKTPNQKRCLRRPLLQASLFVILIYSYLLLSLNSLHLQLDHGNPHSFLWHQKYTLSLSLSVLAKLFLIQLRCFCACLLSLVIVCCFWSVRCLCLCLGLECVCDVELFLSFSLVCGGLAQK